MSSKAKFRIDFEQIRGLSKLLADAGFQKRSPPYHDLPPLSSGSKAIDRLLPDHGFRRGVLVEWLSDAPGAGASVLALAAAREARSEGGALVIIDRAGTFYPPAVAAWGLDLASTIVVHPVSDNDEHWALDQALRCEHAVAVLAWPRRLDSHTFRRLQLAAETSGALGLLVRPASAQREPSWAHARLLVAPRASPANAGWQLKVQLLRSRGLFSPAAPEIVVEIDERTGEIHEARPGYLAAQLAHSAAAQ